MARNRRMAKVAIALLVLCIVSMLWPQARSEADSLVKLSRGQTVYVPVYSHIYSGDREHPFYLAATLSIRNTDPKHPITILEVNYYDSDGNLLKKHVKSPVQISAMASTRYVIKESDKSGGSGANFIVKWRSYHDVNVPIIESVMIGTQRQQGISFNSRGQVIKEESK